ncbi:FecR domain-containing protein [Pseudomonas typographi]|uniref:DUF4880 domain-containing protein n=1 Tax=Pseudomonas typographi TaxID=2715964 RepID=A0ABR7Z3P0_9PSED|nr:FecR domain-containing protein [Pseudomonas typographi]MBD1586587.1 DUF4880 domain-containing protein [Pseudomonas typographi]MBD1600088.1 DUF4880 domain-containing protein [Pseudomonas typographi]
MSANPDQALIREAAHWLAFLQSGEPDPAREQAFLAWQAQDPRHAQVIAEFQQHVLALRQSPLKDVPQDQLLKTLNAPSSRRRFLHGSLAVAGLALGAGVASRLATSGWAWPGDLYTGIAERRSFALPDGSTALLNASSRITPQFGRGQRGVVLQRGELLLDIHPQPRAFEVLTGAGTIVARQQRVLVRQELAGWWVLAQQSPVQLIDAKGLAQPLKAGHWARFNAQGLYDSGQAGGGEGDWVRGLLNANDLTLAQVVEALRPYHRGVLRVAPPVEHLRVSGIFPLDDSQHALRMLTGILPVRLSRITDFWITLEPA